MTAARRRVVRPTTTNPPPQPAAQQRRLTSIRARLTRERAALDRWWKRLRRALTATEKHQRAVKTLERQLTQLTGGANGSAD